MDIKGLREILDKHKKWLNEEEGGECADLRGADLRGANLDYSVLPLWCGSLKAHFDDRQIIQFIYHTVKAGLYSKNVSPEIKEELKKLAPLANKFHRAEECGNISTENNKSRGENVG